MSVIYSLLFEGLLCMVIFQDFRYRALSIPVLTGGLIIAGVSSLAQNGWKQALVFAGINMLLITIQLIGITIYFSVRKKSFINIINTYFGIGDVWFYAVVAFCFSPLNFVMFNLVACFIMLIIYAIAGYASGYGATIPFAGWIAVLLFLMKGSQAWYIFDPYNDYFLMLTLFPGIR